MEAAPAIQKRNLAVLVAAQGFLGAQLPLIFTIGGLAGQQLAPHPCFATLPIALIVLGSMLTATPLSSFMQRFGRQAGFFLGAMGGAAGGAMAAWGLIDQSFPLFLIGSLLTGIYMSSQGFFRFAATDTVSESFKPKAISYVMAAGLVSAVIGPTLVKVNRKRDGCALSGRLSCSDRDQPCWRASVLWAGHSETGGGIPAAVAGATGANS